jgi:ParB family transcriptional regulator, chromosome partitioning protein
MARRRAPLPTLPTPPPGGPGGARPNGLFGELAHRGRMRTVSLDAIAPNPDQPRKHFDPDSLEALADSIRARGVLQPPVVRELGDGRYELIAGERRIRASRLVGLSEVEVILKYTDRAGSLQDALLENVARDDLSPIEKARAYASLVEDLGLTREAIGRQVGESRMNISNYMRLLDLPDEVLDLIDRGQLSYIHGRVLLLCGEQSRRLALARRAVAEGWSTRQLEDAARRVQTPSRRKPLRASTADRDAFVARISNRVNAQTKFAVTVKPGPKDSYAFVVSGSDAARAVAQALGAERLDEPL